MWIFFACFKRFGLASWSEAIFLTTVWHERYRWSLLCYSKKIERDIFQGILRLSQETYINKILERFRMKDCSPGLAPIVKSDKFCLNQYPSNDLKREEMKNIPYSSVVGSLIYAQVCTRPAYAVGMMGWYIKVIQVWNTGEL